MSTLQIHLSEDLSRFVTNRLNEGVYCSAEELIRAALEMLEYAGQ